MITGLDHIQLAMPAGQEDAARAFYGRVLGLAEIAKPAALAGAAASGLHWAHCSCIWASRLIFDRHAKRTRRF